jgi:acetyl-CoA carboxylase biotin carboxyl carrier protein
MAKKKSAPPAPKVTQKQKSQSTDHAFVRDLAVILKETELTEIEVERDGLKIRVARQAVAYHAPPPVISAAPLHASAAPVASAVPQTAASPTTAHERASHPGAVKSPMVGTVYHAPQPGAPPFVKIGAEVKEGQTLLIIEAMKTMNQIPSPRSGKIVDILVKDGQPVEYGEALLIVE